MCHNNKDVNNFMGLLDWLKGSAKPAAKPPQLDWKAEADKKAAEDAVLAEREAIRKRLTGESKVNGPSEADEKEPRALEFDQLIYGKLVQNEGGPIVKGYEYTITGYSQGFTSAMKNAVGVPHRIFLDNHDIDNYNKYPWSEEGGEIIKTTKEIDGKSYVICARYRRISESGENKQDRLFGQMHVIAIPAEEWSIAVIPQLNSILNAKPQTATDSSMDKIKIDNKKMDEKLPEAWFDESVKELILRILTGKSIGLQSWDTKIGETLNKFYFCLLCLPENVSKRISFGAGLRNLKGSVRLGHGMAATTPLRKIGGEWKGGESMDFSLGKRYLGELERILPACQTPRDVLKAVKDLPLELKNSVENSIYPEN